MSTKQNTDRVDGWVDILNAATAYARCCADQEEHRRTFPNDDPRDVRVELRMARNVRWSARWRELCRDTAIKAQALLAEAKRLEDRPTGPEVVK